MEDYRSRVGTNGQILSKAWARRVNPGSFLTILLPSKAGSQTGDWLQFPARGSQRDGYDNLDKQAVVVTLAKQAPQ